MLVYVQNLGILFGVTTQELTLGDFLEEPGVMMLDSWHPLGAVIFKNNHCFFFVRLESCGKNVMGIWLLFQEYKQGSSTQARARGC